MESSGHDHREGKPEVAPAWDAISLGTYNFRDTVYSTGSRSFSGAFAVPGSDGASSFSGNFAGPGAAELMDGWKAPFRNPVTNNWGTMGGVFAGKKGP